MTTTLKTITVIGAGGKMGMRISANFQNSRYQVFYCENSPHAQMQVQAQGREISDADSVVRHSDVVILAVPDIALGAVSTAIVPKMKAGAVLLTLDPAAAYANLIAQRADIKYAVAHPCTPRKSMPMPSAAWRRFSTWRPPTSRAAMPIAPSWRRW
jgi:prephenate dehydrogenase